MEERQRLERELVAAGQARAVAALASGVAHDLHNLLMPMLAAGPIGTPPNPAARNASA